jgi:hypothetical protein
MTIQHLFKNFLEDKQVYQKNIVYWKNILGNIIKDISENYDWLEPQFINGESFFDGNPMVSLICHSPKKAIRIIQEEPESDSIEIGAWVDNFYLSEDELIKELVISLELSSESEKLAKTLIKKWIIEDLNNLQMFQFINQQLYPSNESVSMLVK